MTLNGWWRVKFDITLDGKEVDFRDLSESAQDQILQYIKDGCWQGDVYEETEEDD